MRERFLGLINEFRQFVLRGNVVDLAVGIVIGAAFQAVVKAFVQDLLTPIISIPTSTDFVKFAPQVHGSTFLVGDFVNAVLSFLIVAAVVFFIVVRPINLLMRFGSRFAPQDHSKRDCPYCLSSIPVGATRCAFCTAEVPPVAPPAPPANRQAPG